MQMIRNPVRDKAASQIERLRRCQLIAAELFAMRPEALPIFIRVDDELRRAEAANDPVLFARAIACRSLES